MKQRPVYEDNFHSLIVNENGKDIRIRNPLSTYHKALMEYRPELDLETIMLFEKLLVLHKAFKVITFYYSLVALENELHIKRSRLTKARTFLKKHGILSEVNPGKGKTIQFTLHDDKIISLVQFLFIMPEEESAKKVLIYELKIFFKQYFDKNYLQKLSKGVEYRGKKSITGPDNRNRSIDEDASE